MAVDRGRGSWAVCMAQVAMQREGWGGSVLGPGLGHTLPVGWEENESPRQPLLSCGQVRAEHL